MPKLINNQLPGYKAGYKGDFKYLLSDLKIDFNENTEEDWTILVPKEDQVYLENRKIEQQKVPNSIGYGC